MNHDRSMRVLLSENVIKSRMRKNVISLAGHTMSFVVQALWVLVWLLRILRKKGNLGTTVTEVVLLRCWSSSMDGVLSVLHIAFSTPLRPDCIAIWNFISSHLQRIQGWVNSIVLSRNTRRVNIAPSEVRSRESWSKDTFGCKNKANYFGQDPSTSRDAGKGSHKSGKPMSTKQNRIL